MGEIIVLPEYKALEDKIKRLREELCVLYQELDELRFVICKNIEMEYMLRLGALEYKAYEAQCEYLRAKRRLEMIQAKINRQEKIDIKAIEVILDGEFEQFKKQLEEQIRKMNEAIDRSREEALSAEEAAEIKKLYRSIVKELHPDIDPDSTPERRELFIRAVNAYENGDIETIRIIAEMISGAKPVTSGEDTMTTLYKEKERLEKKTEDVREKIEKIKSEYPYNVKNIVENEEMCAQRRSELEKIISQYKKATAEYTARAEVIMR